MTIDVRVLENPAQAAAELLAERAVPGAQLALSGGNTVGSVYELAARLQPRWRDVDVWFGDERCVPPDDERSNYRLVRRRLLDALAVPPQVHRIRGELPVDEGAATYHAELAGVTLDFALNGIGPDGHTASLFPNAAALGETERLAVAAEPGLAPLVPRVTLTPPVFAASGLLLYLVTGEAKAEAVRRSFAAEPSTDTPASLIRGRTSVALLDDAAASLLDR